MLSRALVENLEVNSHASAVGRVSGRPGTPSLTASEECRKPNNLRIILPAVTARHHLKNMPSVGTRQYFPVAQEKHGVGCRHFCVGLTYPQHSLAVACEDMIMQGID